MYCCDGLQNLVLSAGERGIAVLVFVATNGIRFVLQSRGVAFEDEDKLRPAPIDIKINIACCSGLRFCPYCGRALGELARESPEFFESLAEHHSKFLAATPGL
jgi:hypothetical protein